MGENKESTTILKITSNTAGYTEGLGNPIYDSTGLNYEGGNNSRGEDPEKFISRIYRSKQKADPLTTIVGGAPWSLANKYALFTYNGFHGNSIEITKKQYRDYANNPLMGGDYAKIPSIARIVDYYKDLPVRYDYSDFMWCKYSGYMPNNYLLTLRRFATPCEDNIISNYKNVASESYTKALEKWKKAVIKSKKTEEEYAKTKPPPPRDSDSFFDLKPDISRAVTWLGTDTGNTLSELLSFTYGYKWKNQTSETNTQEVGSDQGYTASPFYERLASSGVGGMLKAGIDSNRGVTANSKYKAEHAQGFDPYETTYPNFVIGPVNVINEMQTRDVGLNFDQDIKLVFEYDLKSYGSINPKVALLDIMANLMVLTYDNANFWGGANRFYGGSGYVAPRFGDQETLRQGNFRGFLKSLVKDIGGGFKNAFASPSGAYSGETIVSGLRSVVGVFAGNFLGKLINNQVGAPPAMLHLKGMITGEATGNWHITVGNPLNPIAMIGNLILDSSNISFVGPLGNDDFPSGIKLECTLKHARPRDKSDFESMFNAGKGRLYAAAYGEEDILNLIGNDVRVYGAFQKSATNIGSGKSTGSEKSNDLGNITDDYKKIVAAASMHVSS